MNENYSRRRFYQHTLLEKRLLRRLEKNENMSNDLRWFHLVLFFSSAKSPNLDNTFAICFCNSLFGR